MLYAAMLDYVMLVGCLVLGPMFVLVAAVAAVAASEWVYVFLCRLWSTETSTAMYEKSSNVLIVTATTASSKHPLQLLMSLFISVVVL